MAVNNVQTRTKSFEEISDENLIRYYTPELLEVANGRLAGELFSDGVLKRFAELGLFEKRKARNELTEKALALIKRFSE